MRTIHSLQTSGLRNYIIGEVGVADYFKLLRNSSLQFQARLNSEYVQIQLEIKQHGHILLKGITTL